jgi:hypothetical protein
MIYPGHGVQTVGSTAGTSDQRASVQKTAGIGTAISLSGNSSGEGDDHAVSGRSAMFYLRYRSCVGGWSKPPFVRDSEFELFYVVRGS